MSMNKLMKCLVCIGLALLLGCADANLGKNPRGNIDSTTVEIVPDSFKKPIVKELV